MVQSEKTLLVILILVPELAYNLKAFYLMGRNKAIFKYFDPSPLQLIVNKTILQNALLKIKKPSDNSIIIMGSFKNWNNLIRTQYI